MTLNLPITAQLVGALASRSTHPKFMYHFNELLARLFPEPTELSNPLWNRTRAEVLNILPKSDCADLLQETNSCSRSRGRPAAVPHCGYCSQCVDRRFGSIAAGLEEYDLSERYEVDIFVDPLAEGEPRTIGESYVRFARQVRATDDEELFYRYSELHDCILPIDTAPEQTAHELANLLKRHAANVLNVTSMMVARHSTELAQGTMPTHSLLRLVVGPSGPLPTPSAAVGNVFRLDGQHWTVAYRGVKRSFNHAKGLSYIARLLSHPGKQFHSLDLAQDRPIVEGPASREQLARVLPNGLSADGVTLEDHLDNDQVLDKRARREFHERIKLLRKRREALLASNRQDQIAQIDDEMAQIEHALQAATGLGGRTRTFNSSIERARKAVSQSIHRSLRAIGDYHPPAHKHLENCLTIGLYCSYNPDSATTWTTT